MVEHQSSGMKEVATAAGRFSNTLQLERRQHGYPWSILFLGVELLDSISGFGFTTRRKTERKHGSAFASQIDVPSSPSTP